MARNPVLLAMALLGALDAALGLGTLQDLISGTALAWLLIASVALKAAIAVWVKGEVTPMVDPRGYDGIRLVPAKPLTEPE